MTMPKARIPVGGFAVLTLTEPWATLVVLGEKGWETRGWPTSYRGPLLIQAAKTMPGYAQRTCYQEPFRSVLAKHGITFPQVALFARLGKIVKPQFQLGAIIGAVELTDTARTERLVEDFTRAGDARSKQEHAFGLYAAGRWGFKLERPRRFEASIPVVGQLGIWSLTGESADAAREQLAKAGVSAVKP